MIVYHGGGYVGLTGALHFALAGEEVTIYDPDSRVVEAINTGKPKAEEFLGYLASDINDLIGLGLLKATTCWSRIAGCERHIVAVPTERAGQPDMSIVLGAVRKIARSRPSATILIESTLQPGTVDRMERPVNGHLAVCPRRDWFADPEKNLRTLPRIVGGVTAACTQQAVSLLSKVSETIYETDASTAEIVKSLENALLHQQIMLVHQLAWAFPDKNIAEAVRLATTHWRLTPLFLGAGSGGRCVPLGSEYLFAASHGKLELAQKALEWDAAHRSILAGLCARHGERTLVLGAAYRPDFKDAGRSPGVDIARRIKDAGLIAAIADPMWGEGTLAEFSGVPSTNAYKVPDFDVVLLATPHSEWKDLPIRVTWRRGQTVIDAQGAWLNYKSLFHEHGVKYVQIGARGWAN